MKPIYHLITLALLSVSTTLLPGAILVRAETPQIEFKPPDIQPPSTPSTSYMLHGGPNCPNYYTHALIPPNQVGLTVASNPHLFFHVDNRVREAYPQTITLKLQIYPLQAKNTDVLYENTVTVQAEKLPAIVSFPIPETVISQLQLGQSYQWNLEIYCDQYTGYPADADYIGGFIYRVHIDSKLANQLTTATPIEQARIYAENGIWYDAVTTLARLRQSDPNNKELATAWATLLQSAGFDNRYSIKLDDLVQAPLLNCCMPVENNHR